jgi:hypothetical protein
LSINPTPSGCVGGEFDNDVARWIDHGPAVFDLIDCHGFNPNASIRTSGESFTTISSTISVGLNGSARLSTPHTTTPSVTPSHIVSRIFDSDLICNAKSCLQIRGGLTRDFDPCGLTRQGAFHGLHKVLLLAGRDDERVMNG